MSPVTPDSELNAPCAGFERAEHALAVHVGVLDGDQPPDVVQLKLLAPLTE